MKREKKKKREKGKKKNKAKKNWLYGLACF